MNGGTKTETVLMNNKTGFGWDQNWKICAPSFETIVKVACDGRKRPGKSHWIHGLRTSNSASASNILLMLWNSGIVRTGGIYDEEYKGKGVIKRIMVRESYKLNIFKWRREGFEPTLPSQFSSPQKVWNNSAMFKTRTSGNPIQQVHTDKYLWP